MSRIALVIAFAIAITGCVSEVVEPWELDHDRIIAVRATPPRIVAGDSSTLDALVGRRGAGTAELAPVGAMVVSPESLADTLALDAGAWVVTAPDDARLAAVRAELGLAADAPVPLTIGVAFPATTFPSGAIEQGLVATKTVWLGEAADNPVLDSAEIAGVGAPATTELVVGKEVDVPMSVAFDQTEDVNWLTSCGTMHDFDLPAAYLRVEPEDPVEGELALVVRTKIGGVAWRVWPIRAE